MDYTNCEKETVVENQETDTVKTAGITIDRQEFDTLRKVMDKSGAVEKTIGIILKIVAVLYLLSLGSNLLMDLAQIADGTAGGLLLVTDIAGITFWYCIIMFVVLKICMSVLKTKLDFCGTACLVPLQMLDRQDLIQALRRMNCSAVKDVYVDADSNVCVQGEKYRYTFKKEDDLLMISPDKENYKAYLEQMIITGSLLKFLAPDAPVNTYEHYNSNVKLPKIKRLVTIMAVVCGVVWLALASNPSALEGEQKYVNMVKNGSPMLYPDSTYGDAFGAFFDDCRWEYFKSTDDQDVVEFHGKCLYGEEKVKIAAQFVVSYEEGTFELYALTINDEVQPELVKVSFMLDVFDDYESGL